MKKIILPLFLFAFFSSSLGFSQATQDVDLQREIEWLQAETFVFSASRHEQKQSEVPASIFVITSEDIRRSTANSIPELLRMVPGMQVSKINGNTWAITARGFQGRYAGKLLVLMDGRTLYTPLFSGVYWDVQDTVLSDIERIEVIKGPGASLWGANAVNGIINIITKHSKKTQGGKVTSWAGKEEKGGASLRYGAELTEKTSFRIFGKNYLRGNEALMKDDTDSYDGIDMKRIGFRMDSELNKKNEVTMQGDLYRGREHELKRNTVTKSTIDIWGGDLLGRWKHALSPHSETTLQVYFDRTSRLTRITRDVRDTIDVDFQHVYTEVTGHKIVWGLGYRYLRDHVTFFSNFMFIRPERSTENLYTGFVQDEITLSDELTLTLGAKLEHNAFTGYESQPTVKAMWTPEKDLSVWGSISRAISTPSRFSHDVSFGAPTGGDSGLRSEVMIGYEMGLRKSFRDVLSLDLSVFHNDYSKVINSGNSGYGYSRGCELAVTSQLSDDINLKGGYSFLEGQITDRTTDLRMNSMITPRHQFQLTSQIDLPNDFEFDTQLFYNSGFKGTSTKYLPYYNLNLRLGWKPVDSLEVSLVGQNLLLGNHHEYDDTASLAATNIRRSFFGKISWDF